MAYFFFSYANVDMSPYLRRFYKDLCGDVRLLVGGSAAEAGFRDSVSIEMGEDWSDELVRQLMTCRVFVAVYSPSYFMRENCGKEWTAFCSRMQTYADEKGVNPASIIPVLWAPAPKMPEVAERKQWKMEKLGRLYRKEGMERLVRRRQEYQKEYDGILRALASRIRDVGDKYRLPEPAEPFVYKDITAAFPVVAAAVAPAAGKAQAARAGGKAQAAPAGGGDEGTGPTHVNLVVVAGTRKELAEVRKGVEGYGAAPLDWVPYHPEDRRRIASYAQRIISHRKGIVSRTEFTSRLETIDSGLPAVLERAEENNELVVILIDAWSTRLARYIEPLREYDLRNEPAVVIMVPANGNDPEVVTARAVLAADIKHALPRNFARHDKLFKDQLSSINDFRRALVKSIDEAQLRVVRTGKVPPHAFPPGSISSPPRVTGP